MNEKRIELELSEHTEKYSGHYSDHKFVKKIARLTKNKSLEGVIKAFILYHTMKSPTTPKGVVLSIIPSLGYFIVHFDLAPDFIPFFGLADDIAAFGITLHLISRKIRELLHDYATPEILLRALDSTKVLFKNIPEEEIKRIINSFALYEPI